MSIPPYLSATRLQELVVQGELSCVEVVEACFERIAALNPRLNALVTLAPERALADARALDQRLARREPAGPLAGVPMTIKDLYEVEGMRSTSGTRGRASFRPQSDATVVQRLRRAGAIILGKSNVPEFGVALETTNELFGPTNNPYDLSRTPGGSSGGAAAAVAAGLCALEMGSDGGGSIRLPSHFCGVAGFKATSFRVSQAGHFPEHTGVARPMGGLGPIARSARDLALAFDVILGADPRDPDALPAGIGLDGEARAIESLRVAYFADNGLRAPTPETASLIERAAALLAEHGARVESSRPPRLDDAFEIHLGLLILDRRLILEWKKDAGTEHLHPWVQSGVDYLEEAGAEFDSNTATLLSDDWKCYRRDAATFMDRFDILISPVAPGPALPHGELTSPSNFDWCSYACLHNVTGWPAAVVRAGTSPEGLPLGLQIAGKPFSDRLVLRVAAFLEQALGGFVPPPGLD